MNILVVEDCELLGRVLQVRFSSLGTVTWCRSGREALQYLVQETFEMVLTDINLESRLRGFDVLEAANHEGAYVVILSAFEDSALVSRAYEMGCNDYFVKDSDTRTIDEVIGAFRAARQRLDLEEFTSSTFITQDDYLKTQLGLIADAARNHLPVLLLGPSGTGKTTIARKIHTLSGLTGQFVELNCSAIPESLLESEMFGYRKGAFSGAVQGKEGLLEKADNGTLFLDEVAAMPLSIQAKLLKALEDGQFVPLGTTQAVHSRFRLISATCEDLNALVDRGAFRKDLYYRIFGHNITLTGLSDRPGDIALLVQAFLARSSRRVYLHSEAMDALVRYPWPGNVRELKKVIEVLASRRKGIIQFEDLPDPIRRYNTPAVNALSTVPPSHLVEFARRRGLHEALEQIKNDLIVAVARENNGRVNKTLQDLKISTNTFYRAMKRDEQIVPQAPPDGTLE